MTTAFDPTALPAPPELMMFLLWLTFLLHFSMLALLFAGLWARADAEWGKPNRYDIERVHRASVVGYSMTITMGVPPLLFVQVLYGRFFYSSSIGIGYPWLAIVGYLMVGFYALYLARIQWDRSGGPSLSGKLCWGLTVLAVLAIGSTYSWNHLKSLSDTPWLQQVAAGEVPHRLLGYFGAVLMTSGAWAMWLGKSWRTDKQVPRGSAWALIGGGAALAIWAMTSAYASCSRCAPAQLLLLVGGGLGIVAGIMHALKVSISLSRIAASVAGLVGLIGLIMQRETYRLEILAPYFDPLTVPVRTQWSAVALFAFTLLAGIATLIWLLTRIRRASQ
jgi:hypothetical protein